jgi:glycosyltransferase involved in cell wall biosynthesis
MPLRCGTFLRPLPQAHGAAAGDRFGANVAEQELIYATLLEDPALNWHLWSSDFSASPTSKAAPLSGGLHLAASGTGRPNDIDVSNRISCCQYSTFEAAVRLGDYVFVVALPLLPRMCEIRTHFKKMHVPICGLLHSVWGSDSPAIYTWLLTTMQECDVIVVTSEAGGVAVRMIIEAVNAQFRERNCRVMTREPRIVNLPFGTFLPSEDLLDQRRARSLLQIPEASFVLLYLGRLSEEYKADLDVLLEAFARLSPGPRDYRLMLAGQILDPAYHMHLRRRIDGLRIGGRTIILENFPEILKTSIYAACDVFISPADSIQETFGLSILEAMAHGKPVIATEWSGYRELIIDGETGFLLRTRWSSMASAAISPFVAALSAQEISHYMAQRTVLDIDELITKITLLANDGMIGKKLGCQARQVVLQKYTWAQASRQFLKLWRDQIEVAGRTDWKASPLVDVNRFFGHYASSTISMDNLLALTDNIDGSRIRLTYPWLFQHVSDAKGVQEVLDAVSSGPVKIEKLLELGCTLDRIVWLAKKGICRIVDHS